MGDLKTSYIIDLAGNLQARARQFSGGLQQLGRQGSASMRLLSGSVAAASRGLDRLGNRYTALVTGAAGVGAVRMVANLEERFVRMGISANRSAEEMDALKKQIFETAKAPDIRVDPGRITSAIEEIVEKTGDLDFARSNIRNIGLALQATGADGQAIGGIMAEFQKMGMGGKAAFEALDILTVQGKEGAFTLKDLAALGPRVVTAYAAMGRTGVPAIREMGAALQVIRQGTGSSEMAATAFEALVRTLGDADKLKVLQRGGIQVFEPGSDTKMRELPAIMEEIIQKTGGSKLMLSKVFDAEAIRAFNAAAGEFQRTGKVESLQKFYNVQADGSTITRDSARAAKTANAALQGLYNVWQKFADSNLTKPIQGLADTLNGLEPDSVERWFKIAGAVGAVVGSLVAAKKLHELGSWARDLVRGPKGGSGATGGLGGGKFGDAVPVYVVNGAASVFDPTNGPMGGKPGMPGGAKPGSGGWLAKAGGRIRDMLLGPKGAPGGILPSGSTGVVGALRGVLGAGSLSAIGGMGAGAMATSGALVAGTGAAAYGLGTLLNQLVGWGVGKATDGQYQGDGWLGEMLYDALNREQKPAEVGGTLKIEIEGAPARVKQVQGKGGMELDVDTGRTMLPVGG